MNLLNCLILIYMAVVAVVGVTAGFVLTFAL